MTCPLRAGWRLPSLPRIRQYASHREGYLSGIMLGNMGAGKLFSENSDGENIFVEILL